MVQLGIPIRKFYIPLSGSHFFIIFLGLKAFELSKISNTCDQINSKENVTLTMPSELDKISLELRPSVELILSVV